MARHDAGIRELREKFVCVRLTHMKGVDLTLFQFDYDLTWAGFFMNADGAIYGRYGSRKSGKKGADALNSIASLKRAMEGALELHRGYPSNKAELEGKRGVPFTWSKPEEMPALRGKFEKPGEAGCIHCHHVYTGLRRSQKSISDSLIWTYPLPESIGLAFEVDSGTRILSVTAGSLAGKAGLQAGDVLVRAQGQPILSAADLQWTLQSSPDRGELKLEVAREGQSKFHTLRMEGPWRQTDLSWRESMWDARPGVWLVELTLEERKGAGLGDGVLGLRIKWVLPRGAAKRAGFQDGDVLVEFDGKTDPLNESQLIARVRQHHAPGSRIPVAVLRAGKRLRLDLEVE